MLMSYRVDFRGGSWDPGELVAGRGFAVRMPMPERPRVLVHRGFSVTTFATWGRWRYQRSTFWGTPVVATIDYRCEDRKKLSG